MSKKNRANDIFKREELVLCALAILSLSLHFSYLMFSLVFSVTHFSYSFLLLLAFFVSGEAVMDLMVLVGQTPPAPQQRVLCRHPFEEKKRAYVTPLKVEPLHYLVWDGGIPASV